MTEPDVALTDFVLAVECAALASWLLLRGDSRSRLRWPFVLFFAFLGVTSLLGGLVHGFFLDEGSRGHALLWPASMLGVGVTALWAWIIGARVGLSAKIASRVAIAAIAALALYAAVILFISSDFRVAVLNYLPAVLFLLVIYILRFRKHSEREVLIGLGGLAMTLVAAAVQQLKIAPHPIYFNHNAFYHFIQAVAIFMIFWSARYLCAGERTPE